MRKGIPTFCQSILGRCILGSPDYEALGMNGGTHQGQNKFEKKFNNVHLGALFCQISLWVWALIFEKHTPFTKYLSIFDNVAKLD